MVSGQPRPPASSDPPGDQKPQGRLPTSPGEDWREQILSQGLRRQQRARRRRGTGLPSTGVDGAWRDGGLTPSFQEGSLRPAPSWQGPRRPPKLPPIFWYFRITGKLLQCRFPTLLSPQSQPSLLESAFETPKGMVFFLMPGGPLFELPRLNAQGCPQSRPGAE